MANISTVETKSRFGVPLSGGTGSGILMPKQKWRFRVTFLGTFGGQSDTRVVTQSVVSCSRPKVNHDEVVLDSYNSRVYIQGKHSWDEITVTVRDDITNAVTRLIGTQEQRQVNHFQQTTPAAASDYKFEMQLEVLDGTNAGATEVWYLEGCYIKNLSYSDSDYSSNEPLTLEMTIRYDNATHYQGDNDINGRLVGGNPFPENPTLNDLSIMA